MVSSHLLLDRQRQFCVKLLDRGWKNPIITKSLDSGFLMMRDVTRNNAHGRAPASVTRSSQHVERDFIPPSLSFLKTFQFGKKACHIFAFKETLFQEAGGG